MAAVNEDEVVGRVIGPYRVLGRLNRGGRLPVYFAQHLYLDRSVALRLLLAPDWAATPGSLDRFLIEAHSVSHVRHENVLPLCDLGETGDGHIYLATELVEGTTLDRMLEDQGPLSGARVRRIGRQIGLGLQAAAAASVTERALSAQDVLLTPGQGTDVVKIDLARPELLSAVSAGSAAPLDGVRVLGLLLYQMVVGTLPLGPLDEAPPDPMLARPDLEIPTDLDAVITRALDPNPVKRWPDLASMLQVLARGETRAAAVDAAARAGVPHPYLEAGSGAVTSSRTTVARLLGSLSPRPLIAGGVAFAVALIVFGALVAARRDRAGHDAVAVTNPTPAAAAPGPRPVVATGGAVPRPVLQPLPPSTSDPKQTFPSPGRGSSPDPGAGPVPESNRASFVAIPSAARSAQLGGMGHVPPPGPGRAAGSPTASAPAAQPLAGVLGGGNGTRRDVDPPLGSEQRAGDESGTIPAASSRDDEAKTVVVTRAAGADRACAVTLGSRPWSEVWIDGRRVGFTPLVDYPIDCGPHDLAFKSPQNHAEKRVPIVVTAGQLFRKTFDLSANSVCVVTLGSRPWSEVWIDGKKAGVTPLVEYQVACGKHEVLFRSNDANVERREAIVVQSGQPLKKVVALVQQ